MKNTEQAKKTPHVVWPVPGKMGLDLSCDPITERHIRAHRDDPLRQRAEDIYGDDKDEQ